MQRSHRILFTLGLIAGLLWVGYQRLDDSQKRHIKEMARQAPYLVPRYLV